MKTPTLYDLLAAAHKDGIIRATKEEVAASEVELDGKPTEQIIFAVR